MPTATSVAAERWKREHGEEQPGHEPAGPQQRADQLLGHRPDARAPQRDDADDPPDADEEQRRA